MKNTEKQIKAVRFASTGRVDTMPEARQVEVSGLSYVPYGRDNLYPNFLLSLYGESCTLQAIITGNVNYVLGDRVQFKGEDISATMSETIAAVIEDHYIFGYAFFQVNRNAFGEVVDVLHIPSEYIRCDKEHQAFWYSEKWKGRGIGQAVVYPAFMRSSSTLSSVYMIGRGRNTYPAPMWSAAIKEVEIERRVAEFNLNEINNNFLSSCVINFNGGNNISEEERGKIEDDVMEKFSGSENGGRILLSFNDSAANRTTIDRISSDDFPTRYEALTKRMREQIFIAFKAQPILFGLTSETNVGFSTTEFQDLFRLYNKTMIQPLQKYISKAFRDIYGEDVLTFNPFTI